jgi:hypothetical protein
MLKIAVLIFAIGALGGLILASSVLRGRLAPWALSIVHMLLGATGLVLTALAVLGGGAGAEKTIIAIALLFLLVAALEGFYLASIHVKKEVASTGIVLTHASFAVIGFLLLAGGTFHLI